MPPSPLPRRAPTRAASLEEARAATHVQRSRIAAKSAVDAARHSRRVGFRSGLLEHAASVEEDAGTTQGVIVNLKEIRDFGRGSLAAYKLPRSLVQLDEMPLTYNWKVDKRRLSTQSADNREIWESGTAEHGTRPHP